MRLKVRLKACLTVHWGERVMMDHDTTTDYIKVQPKRFAPRANRETASGKFWRRLRFLEFEKHVREGRSMYDICIWRFIQPAALLQPRCLSITQFP